RLATLGADGQEVVVQPDIEFIRLEVGHFRPNNDLARTILHLQSPGFGHLPGRREQGRPGREDPLEQGSELAAEQFQRSRLPPGQFRLRPALSPSRREAKHRAPPSSAERTGVVKLLKPALLSSLTRGRESKPRASLPPRRGATTGRR